MRSMRYRTTLVLLIAACALAAVYYIYLMPQARQRQMVEQFESTFFRLDPAKIDQVSIDAAEGAVVAQRTPEGWVIRQPHEGPADDGAIARLFETLSKGRIIKVVGVISEESRFGLREPALVLGVAHSRNLDVLKIGGKTPTGTGFYASSERLAKVFVVNREFVREIYLKPRDMRMKRLLDIDPAEVARVTIRRQADTIEVLRKAAGGWEVISPLSVSPMASPRSDNADQQYVNAFVQALAIQRAERFVAWDGPPEGVTARPVRLDVQATGDDHRVVFDVYYLGRDAGQGALVHVPGSPEASVVRRDFYEMLVAEPSLFMYRGLLPLDAEGVASLLLWSGDHGVLKLEHGDDGQWRVGTRIVAQQIVTELLRAISGAKAEKLLKADDYGRVPVRPLWRVDAVSDEGTVWFEVSDVNVDLEVSSGHAMFVRDTPGRPQTRKVDYLLAHASGLSHPAVVSSEQIGRIFDIVRKIEDEVR